MKNTKGAFGGPPRRKDILKRSSKFKKKILNYMPGEWHRILKEDGFQKYISYNVYLF